MYTQHTNELIQKELRRIAKEIGEWLNSGVDATKDELVAEAIAKYGLSPQEEIQLYILLR